MEFNFHVLLVDCSGKDDISKEIQTDMLVNLHFASSWSSLEASDPVLGASPGVHEHWFEMVGERPLIWVNARRSPWRGTWIPRLLLQWSQRREHSWTSSSPWKQPPCHLFLMELCCHSTSLVDLQSHSWWSAAAAATLQPVRLSFSMCSGWLKD